MSTASLRADETATESPRLAGRYQLLDTLGTGGAGTVYRARDEVQGRIVALKQLRVPDQLRNRARLKALFEREFHTLARLKHPRIIEVYEYGVVDDCPYYTMELLLGQDLQQLAPLPYREACRILRDVTSSLALLHAQRFLHRDVSPRNVRLTTDGRAKLIDFGALTSFGSASEIIGTPMCIAPEVLQRLPLDQRTDLFAVGAVAYWTVTGRPAYAARHLRELPTAWQSPPAPPSHWNPEIPLELDTLIMSLVHLDPLARPPSAAAVIDRLSAIAELPPEEEERAQAAESYLSSGRLVGRDHERAWIKQRLLRAVGGEGCDVALVGPAGIGRSRLLREACLDAQLEAVVTLSTDAEASASPYAVPISLALSLLSVAPEIARRAAEGHASELEQLSPELAGKFDAIGATALPQNPTERRARLQTALHAWFLRVAQTMPVAIGVDNVQAADADSLAFLVGLSRALRGLRLLLVVTLRTGESANGPPQAALRLLRNRNAQLQLRPLHRDACEELVKSLFGDVANSGRVAKLLYERSGGNPRQCLELARLLVQKGIARYLDGTWVLPLEVSSDELPSAVNALSEARLAQRSEIARELLRALSIHRKPLSIERCLLLLPERSEREIYAALDELVAEQILGASQGTYRFERAALREAMLAQTTPDEQKRAHLRAAEAWLESGDGGVTAQVEAGWHLLSAGEELRGADMLAEAQRALLSTVDGGEGVEETVRALEAALEVYLRHGTPPHQLARVLFTLLPLAFFVDRRVALRYGEKAVEVGLDVTGLKLAHRLSRFIGPRWGLVVGLRFAAWRFAREQRRGLHYELREAIGAFCGMVPSVIATHNICYDIAAVERLGQALEPLRLFGPGHIGFIMHEYTKGQLAMGEGREAEARASLEQMDRDFSDPKVKDMLGIAHWMSLKGGIMYGLGILDPYWFGEGALDRARAMDAMPVRLWAMAAAQVRLLYHALRGESEDVKQQREHVELYAVQGGSTWQAEMFWPVLLLSGDVLAQDTIAVRRLWQQLTRRAAEVPSLVVYADAAHAAYLALRGQWAAAIAIYERVMPVLEPRKRVAWSSVRGHFAETLIWAGQHGRARKLVLDTLAHMRAGDEHVVGRFLDLQRQLAMAEAGLGNYSGGAGLLDELLAKYGAEQQPLLVGLLHKSRAEIAIKMQDEATFERHMVELERLFRGTRNPALIAQCDRLAEHAVRHGIRLAAAAGVASAWEPGSSTAQRILSELQNGVEIYDRALRILLHEARAIEGSLYMFDGRGMQLAAASAKDSPPIDAEARIAQLAERAQFGITTNPSSWLESSALGPSALDDMQTEAVSRIPPPMSLIPGSLDETVSDHRELVLTTRRAGKVVLVGAALIHASPANVARMDPEVLGSVASALHDRMQAVSL